MLLNLAERIKGVGKGNQQQEQQQREQRAQEREERRPEKATISSRNR